ASYFGRRLRSLAAVELFPNYLALKAHIGFLPCVVYGSLTLEESEVSNVSSAGTLEISNPSSDNPGQTFLNWVKEGILSHKLIINDSKAKIHTVSGTVFLVTPGLFQRYVQEFPGIAKRVDQEIEEWRWVQKQFENLKVHRKRDNGLNIWACQVQGPRKRTTLKGYVIEEPKLFFELTPPDNPFLKIDDIASTGH
ncbi:conjugal transfer nickase/helicase domain-containing protein, partial [Pseudomonas gessardii]